MIGLRTNAARHAPPLMPERAARQHERDAEEAGWEAQLRRMAKHKPRDVAPAAPGLPAPVTTVLDIVSGRKRHDTLLLPRALPLITGSDPEDLACGKCGTVIASRAGRDTTRHRHPEGDRLIVRCTCRALNLLSGRVGIRSGYIARREPPLPRAASA